MCAGRKRRKCRCSELGKTVEARRSAAGAPRSEAGYLAAAAPRKPGECRLRIARHFSSGRCDCQVSAQDDLRTGPAADSRRARFNIEATLAIPMNAVLERDAHAGK